MARTDGDGAAPAPVRRRAARTAAVGVNGTPDAAGEAVPARAPARRRSGDAGAAAEPEPAVAPAATNGDVPAPVGRGRRAARATTPEA